VKNKEDVADELWAATQRARFLREVAQTMSQEKQAEAHRADGELATAREHEAKLIGALKEVLDGNAKVTRTSMSPLKTFFEVRFNDTTKRAVSFDRPATPEEKEQAGEANRKQDERLRADAAARALKV
jgi:sugar-specific transcriptional regulator TrmB